MKKVLLLIILAGMIVKGQDNGKDLYSIEMVKVEGGTFQMGSNDGESNERPIHEVTVKSFYISKYEVTIKEWVEVMGENPSIYERDNLPVQGVSWNNVQDFIKKLNKKTGMKYRLPTEAEWEYAARGGNKSKGYKFSGSNNIDDVAWYTGNSGNKTHPVGTKQPNELGIYDMSGNVWEWCSDWYGSGYYSISPDTNPQGLSSGDSRVNRGGSWIDYATNCPSANRMKTGPHYRGSNVGLRLVQD